MQFSSRIDTGPDAIFPPSPMPPAAAGLQPGHGQSSARAAAPGPVRTCRAAQAAGARIQPRALLLTGAILS